MARELLGDAIERLGAALPVAVASGETAPETPAQLLNVVARRGLEQLFRIVDQELDMENLKQQRLVGDMSIAVGKLLMRAAESEFRVRRDDAVTQLLELLAAEERAEQARKR